MQTSMGCSAWACVAFTFAFALAVPSSHEAWIWKLGKSEACI